MALVYTRLEPRFLQNYRVSLIPKVSVLEFSKPIAIFWDMNAMVMFL